MAFNFTTPSTTTFGSGFTFGAPKTSTASTPNTGFSFNAPTTTNTGFSFGGTPAATSTAAKGLFGTTTTSAPTGFSFGSTAPTSSSTGSFSFGTPAAATASVAAPSSAATTSTFSLGGTAPATSFSFGAPAASSTSTAGTFSLGTAATATATTGTAPAQPVLSDVTYGTLEKYVNQWRSELEQQESAFLRQATQVNAWDRLLLSNREKISSLNEIVAHASEDQKRLNTELDFVQSQQNELEALLKPLEQEVENLPQLSVQHHTDAERQNTYHLMENVNAQLKSMSDGVKEIIENLNANNALGTNDTPMGQISKILNAHMDALQYIETTLMALQSKTEDINRSFYSYRA